MDYIESCDKLAKMIIAGEFYDPGGAIQFFNDHINDGETPHMALVLVKDSFDLIKRPVDD